MRHAIFVLGPAGSGKSTFCSVIQGHCRIMHRELSIVNLDPAAENFTYEALVDVRSLVELDDVLEAEDLNFGPNGGLVFCMEYLLEHEGISWLKDQLDECSDDETLIFDCPGQIELYTHMDVMPRLIKELQSWNISVGAVFLLDSSYMTDGCKFISGSLAALSTMVQLEVPHLNVLTKVDLLSHDSKKQLESFLRPDYRDMLSAISCSSGKHIKKFENLTGSLAQILQDFSLVNFFPLDINNEETLTNILLQIDISLQLDEDLETKTHDFEFPDSEDVDTRD